MKKISIMIPCYNEEENVPAIGNWNRGSFYEYSDDNDNDDDIFNIPIKIIYIPKFNF